MVNQLNPTIRSYVNENVSKRCERIEEVCRQFDMSEEIIKALACSAGALYQLPRITLIYNKKLENYMKHLYRVPGTSKYVQKKYVRIGEGSIMYSIGHHRFIEMARAAGAVYKINEGTGGTVLISLDTVSYTHLDVYKRQVSVSTAC